MSENTDNTPLSKDECRDLVKLELRIKAGLGVFLKVAADLLEIHDRRLYRGAYPDSAPDRRDGWLRYCAEKWGISKGRAYQMLRAATVAGNLAECTSGTPEPDGERQLRPLAGLSPDDQRRVWQEATAGGKTPTAAKVAELAADRLDGLSTDEKRSRVEHAADGARQRVQAEASRERVRQITRLAKRLRRLHAGLPDVADEADALLDRYLQLIDSSTEGATGLAA